MAAGFLKNLEHMVDQGSVLSTPSDYSGYKILSKSAISAKISEFRGLGTTFIDPNAKNTSYSLRFQKLRWIDLEMDPFHRSK
jgi:hypothetical protein